MFFINHVLKFKYHPNCLKVIGNVKHQNFGIWESQSMSQLQFISMKLLDIVFVYCQWEMG
jgi:hypothetical protein